MAEEPLLDGINHVAVLTRDVDRFVAFYGEVVVPSPAPGPSNPPGTPAPGYEVGVP